MSYFEVKIEEAVTGAVPLVGKLGPKNKGRFTGKC
jgi:hypothetical protein